MTGESSSLEGPQPADAEHSSLTPDEEGNYDLKAKFREALARKRDEQVEGAAHADASKIRGAHGSAANKRAFRRKSGG
ncbi:DUF5302 domain-containing protein [Streptomyces cellulosae]|uniref:DUF5302 domain-containing protein n=1 Tax=Streptomyces cellulosae TaxID=1968 RepID=A0ABW7Y122_STRCE|nr:DUF5302 domain-containing protein [Streptomyces cellulosae]